MKEIINRNLIETMLDPSKTLRLIVQFDQAMNGYVEGNRLVIVRWGDLRW